MIDHVFLNSLRDMKIQTLPVDTDKNLLLHLENTFSQVMAISLFLVCPTKTHIPPDTRKNKK
jgi:hypothetical protein